jgi:B3/4 domain
MAEVRSLPELKKLDQILRTVGVNPRRYPPSTQKLMEYALKRESLPAVNNFVDASNLVSLRTRYSLGAHDLDRIALPIGLRLLQGDETFRPLGSSEDSSVTVGEFAYVDAEKRVICRLDSLQADFSKVTSQTANIVLIIEGTTSHPPSKSSRCLPTPSGPSSVTAAAAWTRLFCPARTDVINRLSPAAGFYFRVKTQRTPPCGTCVRPSPARQRAPRHPHTARPGQCRLRHVLHTWRLCASTSAPPSGVGSCAPKTV